MFKYRIIFSLMALVFLKSMAIPAIAEEETEAQIDQIEGNYQSTYQTGNNNQVTIEQSAVAAGFVPLSGNTITVTQQGDDNQTDIRQYGSSLEATVTQTGNENSAGIEQFGEGLTAKVEQFGNSGSVQIFQDGVGYGSPVSVRQY